MAAWINNYNKVCKYYYVRAASFRKAIVVERRWIAVSLYTGLWGGGGGGGGEVEVDRGGECRQDSKDTAEVRTSWTTLSISSVVTPALAVRAAMSSTSRAYYKNQSTDLLYRCTHT